MSNNSSPRLRRRPHKEITNHDGSSNSNINSKVSKNNKVDIQSGTDDDDINRKSKKRVGIISSTAKAVLIISSLALLLFTIISLGAQHYTANIKELSDTVIKLHQQINALEVENEHKLHLVKKLEGEITETEIELAWETQHVHDVEDVRQRMHDSMHDEIVREIGIIEKTQKTAEEFAQRVEKSEYELAREENENANLKVQLAIALEELGNARSKLPPPPLGNGSLEKGRQKEGSYVQRDGKDMVLKQKERKLRGKGLFQPGDPIEIIEYQEGNKVALRPGIITEVNNDGTYNLVKLESSNLLKNMKEDTFQIYQVYTKGTECLYQISQEKYVPITIVEFMRNSARYGPESLGSYLFTCDDFVSSKNGMKEDNNNNIISTVQEGRAMRMHRFAKRDEALGSDE